MVTVGILGSKVSRETQRVRDELRRRGARVVVADLSGFPAVQRAVVGVEALDLGTTDLRRPDIWLLRQPEAPRLLRDALGETEREALRLDVEETLRCDREVWSWIESLVLSLCDVALVVNHPEAAALHTRKPLLAALLSRAGVRVPETLTTTDRAEAEAFVERHGGDVVCKAAAGGGEARLAVEVLGEEPAGREPSGPFLLQRRIVGPSLRAYVIGGRVVSCSRVVHGDVVDWRADQRGLERWEVGADLAGMLRSTCEVAGLDHAGVDVELDESDGLAYVLDVNPVPMFASYEQASGDDVAGPLAERLIELGIDATTGLTSTGTSTTTTTTTTTSTTTTTTTTTSAGASASSRGEPRRIDNAHLIGIVGPRHDDEVLALSNALRTRGARVRVIDVTGLPGAHRLHLDGDVARFDGHDLARLGAVYIRRLRSPVSEEPLVRAAADAETWPAALEEWLAGSGLEREVSALIWSALSLVPAPMVNTLTAQLVHPRKVHHLRTLAAAGVPVPPFVATNDADVIRDFVSRQPDGAVLKPLRGFAKTRLLQAGEELPCLTRRPVLVQRYVPGATVRVYAVSGRPVAAGEMRNAGHVDTSVDPRAPVLVEPTGDERTIVARAARAAGLPFTGLDLQRPRDGGPAQVLECNAAPMFANFCRRTGADVAGPLADLLVRLARGGEVWKEES